MELFSIRIQRTFQLVSTDNRGLLRKYREYISFIQGFYGFSGLILKRIEACSLECSIYYF